MMRRLLKNYSVQTSSKLIKDAPDGTSPIIEMIDPMVGIGPEELSAYSEIAKDFITHTALTIGATYIACKIVGRICR